MKFRSFCVFILTFAVTATQALAQQSGPQDFCEEVTTMNNDVFRTVSDMNKARIKAFIRPAAKLYKVECLRGVVTMLGGLRRMSIGGFLNGLWSRILEDAGGGLLGRLCNAVLDELPDNWNGSNIEPMPMNDVKRPAHETADRRRRDLIEGVA